MFLQRKTGQFTTRHRATTSTRWHFAFRLCCHSNETRVPIAKPPNSAQLGGTRTIPKLHPGPSTSVRMWRGTDRQTHRRAYPLNISRSLRLTRNVSK